MRSLPSGWNLLIAQLGLKKRRKKHQRVLVAHRRALRMEELEDRRVLAPIMVSTNNDVVNGSVSSIAALIASPGGDGISLREAVTAANADTTLDTITFNSALNGGEILLTRANGQLNINTSLTVDATSG